MYVWNQNGLLWLNPWLYLESIRPTCRGPIRVYWGLRFISVVGEQRTGGKMATAFSRAAALAVARSISSSSKTVIPSLTAAMATNSRRASPLILRWRDHSFFLLKKILAFFRLFPQISWLFRSIASISLKSMESLMPLHSAVASARLKSSIAVDSSFWSWLSQGTNFVFSPNFLFYFWNRSLIALHLKYWKFDT